MIPRHIAKEVLRAAQKYPAIALVGPRQSGKTTLARQCFPEFHYISLENPDQRARALADPRSFLESCVGSTILDEVQNTPDLFSYLQEILDDPTDKRVFCLTGSNSFKLNERISQSLAGRIRTFYILPFLDAELPENMRKRSINGALFTGHYPRIFDQDLEPNEWFASYYETYLQKDVKSITNVTDMNQFDRFVRLCAGRVGQLAEYSSIATEVGISVPTAIRWSSVLESSFICFRLPPHFRNFNKKIIKSPKLYFYDTGLLCQLLRIDSPETLAIHPLRGEIFESFVVSQLQKYYFTLGKEPRLYFWRDQHKHEIDVVLDKGTHLFPVEIKSGQTFHNSWLKTLKWFRTINTDMPQAARSIDALIYGGSDHFKSEGTEIFSWEEIFAFGQEFC